MDGIARPAGSAVPVTLGGKTYLLSGLGLADYGVIEQHILAERNDNPVEALGPYADALAQYPLLNGAMMDKLYAELRRKQAAPHRVTQTEMNEFLNTLDGMVLGMWLQLRPEHPEVGMEQARELVEEQLKVGGREALEKLRRRMDQASGVDLAGNSTGRPPARGGAGALPAPNPAPPTAPSPGGATSATWPTATGGPPPSSAA